MDQAEPIHVHFETDRFVLRTLSENDASQRWADWLNDPVTARMLNVPPRVVSVEELKGLIRAVDQYEKLVLGVFLLGTNTHVGVVRMRFIDQRRRMTPGVLIGDPAWRNVGALQEVANAVGTYFFEAFDLEAMVARVPTYNAYIIKYLEDREWRLVGKEQSIRADGDGKHQELFVYELPRSVWLDRKQRGFFGGPKSAS